MTTDESVVRKLNAHWQRPEIHVTFFLIKFFIHLQRAHLFIVYEEFNKTIVELFLSKYLIKFIWWPNKSNKHYTVHTGSSVNFHVGTKSVLVKLFFLNNNPLLWSLYASLVCLLLSYFGDQFYWQDFHKIITNANTRMYNNTAIASRIVGKLLTNTVVDWFSS